MADGLRLRKAADPDKDGAVVLRFVGDPPPSPAPSTAVVETGLREGWISRENERPVARPGGPAHSPWAASHTFIHADALVFHTRDGDVRYRVVGQPDKYGPKGKPVDSYDGIKDLAACDVRWFYQLELEG